MDHEFLKESEKRTTFNIPMSHFQSLDKKEEIQYLFKTHWFDQTVKTIDVVDKDRLNATIVDLKTKNIESFGHMHKYKGVGVGPGEISLYFMVDSAILGGASSAGIDLTDAEFEYEIKAAEISKDRYAKGFELGRAVPLSGIVQKLNELKHELELGNPSNEEINRGDMGVIREMFPQDFTLIEEEFKGLAYEYFRHHKTIFINNSEYSPCGRIEEIKYVQPEDISIDSIKRRTVQPSIKL